MGGPRRMWRIILSLYSRSCASGCGHLPIRTLQLSPSTASAARKSGPMSSRHMDQRFDSSGSSYTSNCNLELASAGLGRTPKLLSGIDRPSPCALMYASFAVQQLKNDAITSEGGCDRNHCTSGSEKKRSANSI